MRQSRAWCVGLLVFLASYAVATGKEIDKKFHQTFDVSQGAKLRLMHDDGDVSITPWERDVVEVDVRYRADVSLLGLGREADFDVEFRRSGDTIHVIGRERGRTGITIGARSIRRYEYTYTVRAPSYVDLDLEGDDGNVEIEGWQGTIDCKLDDGDLTLRRIRSAESRLRLEDGDLNISGLDGEIEVTSDDGDVLLSDCRTERARFHLEDGDLKIQDCEGNLEIRSDDGDVELGALLAGSVDVRTSDGDIEIDLVQGGDVDLKVVTEDGRVNVLLEEGLSTAFTVDTQDGRIRVDLAEVEHFEKAKDRVSGAVGGGAGTIHIRTDDGSVTLRER